MGKPSAIHHLSYFNRVAVRFATMLLALVEIVLVYVLVTNSIDLMTEGPLTKALSGALLLTTILGMLIWFDIEILDDLRNIL